MPAKTTTKRPTGARSKSDNVFTDEERAAVRRPLVSESRTAA